MLQARRSLPERIYRQYASKHNRRDACPCCGSEAPKGRRGVRWAESYGHRCAHGEPCPAFSTITTVSCAACRAQLAQQRTG